MEWVEERHRWRYSRSQAVAVNLSEALSRMGRFWKTELLGWCLWVSQKGLGSRPQVERERGRRYYMLDVSVYFRRCEVQILLPLENYCPFLPEMGCEGLRSGSVSSEHSHHSQAEEDGPGAYNFMSPLTVWEACFENAHLPVKYYFFYLFKDLNLLKSPWLYQLCLKINIVFGINLSIGILPWYLQEDWYPKITLQVQWR